MNIIRTKAVELTVIPAVAYKQKLSSGGAGIKIIRLDQEASAVATIDKRSGDLIPYRAVDENIFPTEAFEEALELTSGIPYSARGKIKIVVSNEPDENDISDETPEKVNMVDSDEYKAIVERYSDEKGQINYTLMNKDFIQFVAKSKIVSDMVGNNSSVDEIMVYTVKNRAGFIAGIKEPLDDASVEALIETLDEINPRSAFKELKSHVIKTLAKNKRK